MIQVPKLEIHNLGLHIQTEPKTVQIEQVPLVTSEVAKQETLNSNVETADKINEDKVSHFVYKIIKPEDLNLKVGLIYFLYGVVVIMNIYSLMLKHISQEADPGNE